MLSTIIPMCKCIPDPVWKWNEMNRKVFLTTIFLTLVSFNLSRVIGWKFFADTRIWTRIVNDNLHHWQLGLVLIALALIIRKLTRKWYLLLAVSIGMVIDESMYLFSPLYWRLNHYSWEGIAFEFLVFITLSLVIVRFDKGVSI